MGGRLHTAGILGTPLRRASLCVATAGAIAICGGAYNWITTYPNTIVYRTSTIPNYPRPEEQFFRQSLVQIHRRCEWQESAPPNANVFDLNGPVMLYDQWLSLDASCAEKVLDRPALNRAGILLAFSNRSQQLMMREAARKEWWYTQEKAEDLTAHALYERNVTPELVKQGLAPHDATRLLKACIKTEPKFCVEAQRHVYVNVWSVIWSTWSVAIGFVLLTAGLAGSIFLSPIAALWRISGGRVVEWIRRG